MELPWILQHEADDHAFLYALSLLLSLLFITQPRNLSSVALLKEANGSV